ncbi:MAG: SDR family oxidoreductase [Acidobacteriota bacterium]|nr:SDR family oxidoreductase [Acidobacteriota bacterium]
MSSRAKPWAGEWAIVTGASSGIGLAIAEELAAGGTKLVLVARRKDRLMAIAARLPVRVEVFEADLGQDGAVRRLFEFTEAREIHPALLVNNAGFGTYGEFCKTDYDRQMEMVRLNCMAVVGLTHLYLPRMIARKSGDILILASTAAFQAVPYQTVYAATKAFDLIFAEGLAEEVKRHGVRVCALCPGQTESEFHQVAQEPIPKAMSVQTAAEVARIGLNAMRAGKHFVVCGFSNMLGMEIQRLVPRRVVTRVSERLFRPDPGS